MPAGGGYLARLDALRVWSGLLCLECGVGGAVLWAGAGVRRRYWGDGHAALMEVAAYLRWGCLPVCYETIP